MKTQFYRATFTVSAILALTVGAATAANLNVPTPDPTSPKMPNVRLNVPTPDPTSPKMPNARLNVPTPDPTSPKMPNLY